MGTLKQPLDSMLPNIRQSTSTNDYYAGSNAIHISQNNSLQVPNKRMMRINLKRENVSKRAATMHAKAIIKLLDYKKKETIICNLYS